MDDALSDTCRIVPGLELWGRSDEFAQRIDFRTKATIKDLIKVKYLPSRLKNHFPKFSDYAFQNT